MRTTGYYEINQFEAYRNLANDEVVLASPIALEGYEDFDHDYVVVLSEGISFERAIIRADSIWRKQGIRVAATLSQLDYDDIHFYKYSYNNMYSNYDEVYGEYLD